MTTFLLWNVQRKPLDGFIVRLVEEHNVDMLVLIEHSKHETTLLSHFDALKLGPFELLESHDRFGVLLRRGRLRAERIPPPVDHDRMDFWRLEPESGPEILLVALHGFDLRNYAEETRSLFFEQASRMIQWMESRLGHKRTLVVGDLNANPFDEAIGGVRGLHAIMPREVSGRKERKVLGTHYEFFHNPMWDCYGHGHGAPPATYYHYKHQAHELFWHMLDQVVLRPDLLPWFARERLRILDEAGHVSLLTKRGTPDAKTASDHLPVLFGFDFATHEASDV